LARRGAKATAVIADESLMSVSQRLVSDPLCGVIDNNRPCEGCYRIARLKE